MTPKVHASGMGFPEGPVVLPDGSVAFVDLLHQKIRAVKDGTLRELATVQGSPNGMRLGPDGALYICNNGGIAPTSIEELKFAQPQISGRLQRLTLDGKVSDFAVDLPGEGPHRPNDLVFSPAGDIVFTDPQNWEALGEADPNPPYHGGQILLATPKGKVKHLAKMTGFPNGLVFHPDGSLLVGLTVESRIVQFPWHGDSVGAPRTWCSFDGAFRPDGMVFRRDRLYVTGSLGDRVAVIDVGGTVVDTIHTGAGSDPTNCCFQGDTLWVTLGLGGKLVSYQLPA